MADQTIQVLIKGADEASPTFQHVSANVSGLEDAFNGLDHAINFATEVLSQFVVSALSSLGRAIGELASEMISSNAQFEQYTTQFTVLLGSVDAAHERMAELAQFGATTPFDLPGVVEADRILQGFGLHAEDVAEQFGFSGEVIRRIAGDVAAGTGSSFQEMAMLIGRFSSGATGEALMRMAELGIGTRAQLAEMGIEFSKSGELLSPLPEAMQAVLTLMNEKYGGLMEAQSLTFEGMSSNLRDWMGQTIRQVGAPIFDILKDKLVDLLAFLNSPETQAGIENLADGLGNAAGIIADVLLPMIENTITALPGMITWIGNLVAGTAAFIDLLVNRDYEGALGRLLGVDEDDPLISKIFGMRDAVMDFGSALAEFLGDLVAAQDVMVGFAIALTAAFAPVLAPIAGSLLTIIAIVAAVVAGIALLRSAWENDWMGIQSTLTEIWDNTLLPAFSLIQEWAERRLPPIIERFAAVWRDHLLPELQEIWGVISSRLLPVLGVDTIDVLGLVELALDTLEAGLIIAADAVEDFAIWFDTTSEKLDAFITQAQRFSVEAGMAFDTFSRNVQQSWQIYGEPTMQEMHTWFDANVPDALLHLQETWALTVHPAMIELARLWDETLEPALTSLAGMLGITLVNRGADAVNSLDSVSDSTDFLTAALDIVVIALDQAMLGFSLMVFAIQDVIDWVEQMVLGIMIFIDVAENILIGTLGGVLLILDPVVDSFRVMRRTLNDMVSVMQIFAEGLASLDDAIPEWLIPGSPTPFELGLRGVSDAMQQLSRTGMPQLNMGLGGLGALAGAGAQGGGTTNENYNLQINTNAPAESAITDFSLMKFLAGQGNTG